MPTNTHRNGPTPNIVSRVLWPRFSGVRGTIPGWSNWVSSGKSDAGRIARGL
jgi:hypothetical protein